MITIPAGILPIVDLSTTDILYGSRESAWRFDILTHDVTTGLDSLYGTLDGVESGQLQWSQSASVKGSGSLKVADLPTAAQGLLRPADVNLITARIRPVLTITGLPEIPFGVYVITAAPEDWADTGRLFNLELHDKATVLDQDAVSETFTADTTTPILGIIQSVIESAGETINIDAGDTTVLASPMVWAPGTTKLTIINDLLAALNYFSLWVDYWGNFQATPYVKPADRSIGYEILTGLDRELLDGNQSIYIPDFTRDRDSYNVPNKVVAVAAGTGTTAPPSGSATNTDTASPYSYPSRGRWITKTLTDVQIPDFSADPDPVASAEAFLSAKALQSLLTSSAVQAAIQIKCLPIPTKVNDVLRFRSVPAGVDARHAVVSLSVDTTPTGLMSATIQEVIDL